jgi:hypothetical protein
VAKVDAIMLEAGGRELRVSSGDRVTFPPTERTAEVTKLQIVEYYLAVEDGIIRALRDRPTTLERWPKGVHPGIMISTRERGGGDAFYQKRIPKGAPEYVETARIQFPSGRHADEICPTEIAVVGWCAQMGTIVFHPWPVRRTTSTTPTSCGSTSIRSSAPTSRTPCASRPRRGSCSASSGTSGSRRPRAGAACTSTCGSSRAGGSPTSATRRSRSAASSSAGCPGS